MKTDAPKEFFQDVIRNPSDESADSLYGNTVPDSVTKILPDIGKEFESDGTSEELAQRTMWGIFDFIEEDIFGEGVDMIIENFGPRIIELVINGMTSVLERIVQIS